MRVAAPVMIRCRPTQNYSSVSGADQIAFSAAWIAAAMRSDQGMLAIRRTSSLNVRSTSPQMLVYGLQSKHGSILLCSSFIQC